MALIKCSQCGKEISDSCNRCIYCGYLLESADLDSAGSVVIYSYTGWYLVKPNLKIYINGKYFGDLSYKARTKEIPITEPTDIEIKCNMRSTLVRLQPNKHYEIHTEFNRASGSILAEVRSW